ncbi:MAG: putative ABC transporter permease [Ruminococcus sp.]|nr:putative ABC transporter permease [Ruminococcus sp.]
MATDIYTFLWYFVIYAFFGWCLEVIYQAVEHGKFINRGFLNGPYCPIYGFGVIIVTGTLEPLKENIIVLYIGSVILTTVLELVTGFLLEKIFHQNWWDYSDERFNLKGYICLKFSLLWGIACLIAVRLIHTFVETFVEHIPKTLGTVLISVAMVGFASDMIITVFAVIHIRNRLTILPLKCVKYRTIQVKSFTTVLKIQRHAKKNMKNCVKSIRNSSANGNLLTDVLKMRSLN